MEEDFREFLTHFLPSYASHDDVDLVRGLPGLKYSQADAKCLAPLLYRRTTRDAMPPPLSQAICRADFLYLI